MNRTASKGGRPLEIADTDLSLSIESRIRRVRNRRRIRQAVTDVLLTAAAVYLLFGVVMGVAVVSGSSMEPSLRERDVVLFLRIDTGYNPEDIVLSKAEGDSVYIKRIAAVPGQTVDINEENGALMIDGTEVSEPYVYTKTAEKTGMAFPYTLGEGEYLLLGDNRENSYDSRNYGPVKEEDIKGKIFLTVRMGS